MFRSQLPRIYELRDCVPTATSENAYFHNLDESLRENPIKFKIYRDYEKLLQGLDPSAWRDLKNEARAYLIKGKKQHDWSQFFNLINQARAYNYLAGMGCCEIRFIPRGCRKTPDIEAVLSGQRILCEVKTLNTSEREKERARYGEVISICHELNEGFFGKLKRSIETAIMQLYSYDPQRESRFICFIIINFDDHLHEYADHYNVQINKFLSSLSLGACEVVTYMDPPFYRAIS